MRDESYEECYCSVTLFPPCNYCTSHFVCEGCIEQIHYDDCADKEKWLCTDCVEKKKNKSKESDYDCQEYADMMRGLSRE